MPTRSLTCVQVGIKLESHHVNWSILARLVLLRNGRCNAALADVYTMATFVISHKNASNSNSRRWSLKDSSKMFWYSDLRKSSLKVAYKEGSINFCLKLSFPKIHLQKTFPPNHINVKITKVLKSVPNNVRTNVEDAHKRSVSPCR